MELENIVEKITREVMDTLKTRESAHTPQAVSVPVTETGNSALLLCGADNLDSGTIAGAVSLLKQRNFNVTLAVSARGNTAPDVNVPVIRCGSAGDILTQVKNCGTIAILIPDIATASKTANLIADRFDIEAVISALESGRPVWGINLLNRLSSPTLSNKINGFIKEMEGFGISMIKMDGPVSSYTPSATAPKGSTCPMTATGDCAGCGLCPQLAGDQVRKVINQGAERISAAPGTKTTDNIIAGMIDHTLLKADATRDEIVKLCEEARKYTFASCCVNPAQVALTAQCLKGSPVKTCTVIGFPLGATTSMVKAMETRDAIANGADEIDMVINVGALKAGDYDLVKRDISAVVDAAKGHIVKVILETALLTDEEKVKACQLSKEAGADFVKTSTGFGPGGATAKDIALMRQTVGQYMGVKASGGIRDFETANEMIKAGATRIGASASVGIVKGEKSKSGGY